MFTHLHCHSHYSFLRGVNPPEEIIAAAVEQKMPAVALTDSNGMYAAIPFYEKAKAAGVKPLLGVVLDVEKVGELQKEENRTSDAASVPMVLLAADAAGYSNLCQLTTLRHLGAQDVGQQALAEGDGRPVTLEELTTHSAGVIALYPVSLPFRAESAKRGISLPPSAAPLQLRDYKTSSPIGFTSKYNTFRPAMAGHCATQSGSGKS